MLTPWRLVCAVLLIATVSCVGSTAVAYSQPIDPAGASVRLVVGRSTPMSCPTLRRQLKRLQTQSTRAQSAIGRLQNQLDRATAAGRTARAAILSTRVTLLVSYRKNLAIRIAAIRHACPLT